MQFKSLLAALIAPLAVLAQGPNSFNVPSAGYSLNAGQSYTFKWTPTTQGKVSLILRSGAASNLAQGTAVATNIDNSGSYTWMVPSDITKGSDYAVQIVDDSNPSQVNYTPHFMIDSTNTVASSTGLITMGALASSAMPSVAASSTMPTSAKASSAASSVQSSAMAASSMASSMASSAASSATGAASSARSAVSSAAAAVQTSLPPNAAAGSRAQGALAAMVAVGAGAAFVL